MIGKLTTRMNYMSQVSRITQVIEQPYYQKHMPKKDDKMSYVPKEIQELIQRPFPGQKLETRVLGEICLISCHTNSPINIQIVQGDVIQETSDAIINPADPFLTFDGGVGAQIVKYGGEEILREAKYIIEQEGCIPTGNVTVTTAGDLNSQNIIHAVGPNSNCPSQNGLNQEKLLAFAVKNCFKKASELGCRSLSVPAISCGENGFPKIRCVQTLFQSIKDFQNRQTLERSDYPNVRQYPRQPLQLVRFVNRNPLSMEIFLQEFYKMINTS